MVPSAEPKSLVCRDVQAESCRQSMAVRVRLRWQVLVSGRPKIPGYLSPPLKKAQHQVQLTRKKGKKMKPYQVIN